MHGATLIFVLIGVLLYLMMGALVFNALEAPNEESHRNKLQAIRQEFMDNYTCVDPKHLSDLIEVSIAVYNRFSPLIRFKKTKNKFELICIENAVQ